MKGCPPPNYLQSNQLWKNVQNSKMTYTNQNNCNSNKIYKIPKIDLGDEVTMNNTFSLGVEWLIIVINRLLF